MKNEKIQVDRVSRDVIEGQLLTSLNDGAHVAIVCSEVELSNLIEQLRGNVYEGNASGGGAGYLRVR